MTFPVFRSRPTAIFTYLTSTSGSCVDAQHRDGVDCAPHRYCFIAKGNFTSRTKMLLLILYYVVCAKNVVYPEALP